MKALSTVVLALLPLALFACSDAHQGYQHDNQGDGAGTAIVCSDGVAIDVSQATLASAVGSLPLMVHVCFDQSCDDLIVRGSAGALDCQGNEPNGGGAADQLTSCSASAGGDLHVEIARTDGRSYADGAEHTIAIAIGDTSPKTLLSYAEQVQLQANPDGCFTAFVTVKAPK